MMPRKRIQVTWGRTRHVWSSLDADLQEHVVESVVKGEVCGCCCVLFGGLRCCEGHSVNIMGSARQEWDDAYRGEMERHEPSGLFFFSRSRRDTASYHRYQRRIGMNTGSELCLG